MNTPICDFARAYAAAEPLRLHMPGHKGCGPIGAEALDLTEIAGADSLFEPETGGIIAQSEANAAVCFGTQRTLYSCEGSSLAIRTMVLLALRNGQRLGRAPLIFAGRNAHRAFLTAAALLDLRVRWLGGAGESYLCARITPEELEAALAEGEKPFAVYVTSPDYLGTETDIAALSAVCRRHEVLLLVDNAHGAYLHFLAHPRHPMDLGADLCCDSAHKTLRVLTGGAYLHIGRHAPAALADQAKQAMGIFASTSPSYLILQSLDAMNAALAGDWPARLREMVTALDACKARLTAAGFVLAGTEPLKLTLTAAPLGYSGQEIAGVLAEQGIVCEFADPDHLVLMPSPDHPPEALERVEAALLALPKRAPRRTQPPQLPCCPQRITIREALLAPQETIPIQRAEGRILGAPSVGCPPAVPILVSGEEITAQAVACFRYYGIDCVSVLKE